MAVHLSGGCHYTSGSSYSSGSSASPSWLPGGWVATTTSYLELTLTTTTPPLAYLPALPTWPGPADPSPFRPAPPGPGDRAEAVRLAEAAAARLRDKGWTRGTYGAKEGPNCLLGALGWEAVREYGHAQLWPGWRLLMAALRNLTLAGAGMPGSSQAESDLISWNDGFCPSAEAAIDTLLTAAKRLSEEGTL